MNPHHLNYVCYIFVCFPAVQACAMYCALINLYFEKENSRHSVESPIRHLKRNHQRPFHLYMGLAKPFCLLFIRSHSVKISAIPINYLFCVVIVVWLPYRAVALISFCNIFIPLAICLFGVLSETLVPLSSPNKIRFSSPANAKMVRFCYPEHALHASDLYLKPSKWHTCH